MQDRIPAGNGTDNILRFNIPDNVDTIGELIAYMKAGAEADIAASDTATVDGTPISKQTLLSAEAAHRVLGMDSNEATPSMALLALTPIKFSMLIDVSDSQQDATSGGYIANIPVPALTPHLLAQYYALIGSILPGAKGA